MRTRTSVIVSVLLGLIAVFSGDSSGKELKIGYIDSNRILTEYKGMADVQSKLEKAKSEWDKETQMRGGVG